MLSDQSLVNSIQNFSSSLYANIIESLIDVDINIFKDKNLMNHHFMRYNMMRKDVQKALTRSGLGENAYINGDSSNPSMLIPMPSYTYNHLVLIYSLLLHHKILSFYLLSLSYLLSDL